MNNNSSPLVTIIVITYNSAQYVLETLESAKAQTYSNIELIVSDDGSSDNTVEICREWIEENKERFVSTELITISKNTGIPANCNRGIKAAKGKWIKFIAGDDILLRNCIEVNINFINKNHDAELVFSIMNHFLQKGEELTILKSSPANPQEFNFFENSAKNQFKKLLTQSFNIAPTSFLKKKTLVALEGFDEKYQYIEDLPFWLKATNHGIQLKILQKPTILYRVENESVSRPKKSFYNIPAYECFFKLYRERIFMHVPIYNFIFWNRVFIDYLKFLIIIKIFKNKRTDFTEKVSFFIQLFKIEFLINKFFRNNILNRVKKTLYRTVKKNE